jgi:hypothetical protein
MGGLDWGALETVCAMLNVKDPEWLIRQLVILRDQLDAEANG